MRLISVIKVALEYARLDILVLEVPQELARLTIVPTR